MYRRALLAGHCRLLPSLIFPFTAQFENSLRRHNHVGLIHVLLLQLAKAGKLEPAKEEAKNTMKGRIEKRAKGEAMVDDE
jgi:hypothetical protein